MRLRNTYTNTEPIVYHAPGATRRSRLWGELQKYRANGDKPPRKTDISWAVITWSTSESKSVLEASLACFGGAPIVLGRDSIGQWENRHKLDLTVTALSMLDVDVVIGLDAYDVVLLDHPSEIVNRFKRMPWDIVFNASPKPWPADHAEPLVQASLDHEYDLRGKYRHINAGAWVAKRSAALSFFQRAAAVDTSASVYPWSEQIAVRRAWEESGFDSGIGVDSTCYIFQHMRGKGDLAHVA